MIGVKISQIEYHLPDTILNNKDVASVMPGWSADKIYDKIGIKNRHISSEDETALDIATKACNKIRNQYSPDISSITIGQLKKMIDLMARSKAKTKKSKSYLKSKVPLLK